MEHKILLSQKANRSLYKLVRDDERFVLKEFAALEDNIIDLEKDRLEKAEYIAHKMIRKGISAVCAIQENYQYIHKKGNTLYAIYPWIDAKPINEEKTNPRLCYEMGKLIANIHKLALKDEYIPQEKYRIKEDSFLDIKIDQPMNNELILRTLSVLKKYDDKLEKMIDHDIFLAKSERNILCHRDTGCSNVLLYKGSYCLIDWEHAGYEYPEFELLDTCLEWSCFRTGTNWANYRAVVQGYYGEIDYIYQVNYDALMDRMLLSILRRIKELLIKFSITKETSYLDGIRSYLFQVSELEKDQKKYIENLKPI